MKFYQLSVITLSLALLSACGGKGAESKNEQVALDSIPLAAESLDEIASDSSLIKKFGVDYTELNYDYKPASINLFLLEKTEKENIAFSSFSDIYHLSDAPDSSAIPNLQKIGADELNSIRLEGKYRTQFLKATHISESDSVYVLDYENNSQYAFLVKDLKVVANISPYEDMGPNENAAELSQYSYRIGFELDAKVLQPADEYFQYTIISVGKSNPFTKEALVPIKWTKIEDSKYPIRKINIDDVPRFVGVRIKHTYTFEKFDLEYFIQVYAHNEYGNELSRLIVLNKKTGGVIVDEIYGSFEGSESAPLNYIEADNTTVMQWTGNLLKGRGPVVFGFEYPSFGCSSLTVLDKTGERIYFNCDNRH